MRASRELHDQLRAALPENAECIDDCPYCTDPEVASAREDKKVSDEKVYDQATMDALLADARSKASEEAKAETADEIERLKAEVQEKDEALAKAEAEAEELRQEIEDAKEQARLEALADERASLVKEASDLSDEKIEERKSAWAEMEEAAFSALLEDLKAAREAASENGEKNKAPKPPGSKNLDTTRETAGDEGTDVERLRKSMSTLLSVGGK